MEIHDLISRFEQKKKKLFLLIDLNVCFSPLTSFLVLYFKTCSIDILDCRLKLVFFTDFPTLFASASSFTSYMLREIFFQNSGLSLSCLFMEIFIATEVLVDLLVALASLWLDKRC